MNKKAFTVYFFSIEKMIGVEQKLISKKELAVMVASIQRLSMDRHSTSSRYYDNGKDERYVVFQSDRNDIPEPNNKSYVPGLFIKRRTSNYPYENDDSGNLFPIKLSDDENKLAEVTFFVIDTSLRVLLFVSNKYVGSSSAFEEYINKKLSGDNRQDKHVLQNTDKRIALPFIINENPEKEFDLMVDVSTMELRVAGSLPLLESLLVNDNNSSAQSMKTLAQFAQQSRSQSINLIFSSGHQRKEKLDKSEIRNLYKKMKRFFKNSDSDNKFVVKGVIDEETRYLDLLNDQYFHKSTFDYDGPYLPLTQVFKDLYLLMDKYREIFIRENKFSEDKS
jgi:hypothetical protein